MKVFLDTNIIIDFYQQREPFFFPAATIFDLALSRQLEVYVSAATVLNAFYILRKAFSRAAIYEKMRELMRVARIIDVGPSILQGAATDEWPDFEDCVQYRCACEVDADCIITRNPKDFKNASISVMEPIPFLDSLFSGV